MENKFTPGPWGIHGPKFQTDFGNQKYWSLTTRQPQREDGKWVLPGFYYPHSVQSEEEMLANAKLIAAAPDLLEICQLINSSEPLPKHLQDQLEYAIQKATV